MKLYQQTQLATQQGYLRALHELEAMQHSIELQERLIDQINQHEHANAAPALQGHSRGMPGITVQLDHIDQIKTINALIESHGWSKCYLHPSIAPRDHNQVWIVSHTYIDIGTDENGRKQERVLHGFAIDYLAKEVQ